ncbi:DUF1349 domain-containing protein [Parendozoicomonas haliclonae]|nr:DUF1349 domain-containing protein [Parendozoicomonas haliclonae]
MIDFQKASWIYQPQESVVTDNQVVIKTEPGTDFWQRSYYGFRNDNAPALLLESDDNFTFTAVVEFDYQSQFDQCGLIIYLDNDNWFKASIEYENPDYSRLGSVVTNRGYSDWATADIELPEKIWYRLSRRGPDFLIEYSLDGDVFRQMRIFHLHLLGETSQAMGKANPPLPATGAVRFGVYACSPLESSFTATFSQMTLEHCIWKAHAVA